MRFTWIFLFIISPLLAIERQPFDIKPCRGMASAYEGASLRDDLCTDSQNVIFDKDLGVTKPMGFTRDNPTSLGSSTISEMLRYVDKNGQDYLVVIASNVLAYSLGNSSFTTIISTLNPSIQYDCVSALGKVTCVSSSNTFYWTGGLLTVDTDTNFPKGTSIAFYGDRIWVASGSYVYGSKFRDSDNWTLAGGVQDPVQFSVSLDDGEMVNKVYPFADALIFTKPHSLGAIVGKDQSEFQKKILSPFIGCIQPRSMRDKASSRLYWLSHRGLEKMEGGQIVDNPPFYDPIKDITAKVIQGYDSSPTKTVSDDSQSDFELGQSSYANTVSLSGSVIPVQPSTQTAGETISEPPNGPINLGNQNHNIAAQSFRLRFNTNAVLLSAKIAIDKIAFTPSNSFFRTYISSGSTISESTQPTNVPLTSPKGYFATDFTGQLMFAEVLNSTVSLLANVTYWLVVESSAAQSVVNEQPFWIKHSSQGNIYPDGFTHWRNSLSSLTQIADTDFYFQLTFSSTQLISRIFDLVDSAPVNPRFDASYVANGGTAFFYVRSNASAINILTDSWVRQTQGSTSAVTVSRFFQYRYDAGFTNQGNYPELQSVTLSFGGVNAKQNVASWTRDGSYYLACSTNTTSDSYNETVIIVDRFENFTKLNGVNASSFAESFENFYFGTSRSLGGESGLLYRFTDALDYNGNPIYSYIVTGDQCMGDCGQEKFMDSLRVRTKSGSSGGTMSTSFQFDRDGIDTQMGDISLTEGTGMITAKLPFSYAGGGGSRGKSIRLKLENNQVGHGFNFYGARAYFRPLPTE